MFFLGKFRKKLSASTNYKPLHGKKNTTNLKKKLSFILIDLQ